MFKRKTPKGKLIGLVDELGVLHKQVQNKHILTVFNRLGWIGTDIHELRREPLRIMLYTNGGYYFRVYHDGNYIFDNYGKLVFKGGEWVFRLSDVLKVAIPLIRRRAAACNRLERIIKQQQTKRATMPIDDYGSFDDWD
jgi:hypothetical protein